MRRKVPTILQMEAVECGAACLAMILAYHGRYVPLEKLRIACGVSRDGSKAGNLLRASKNYGLETKGFRLEPQTLRKKKCPMIIHWNFNHFVVLEGFGKNKVHINDPAYGSRVVSEEEFDQSFTGVVLTFEKGEDFKKGGEKPSMLRSLKHRLKGSEEGLLYIILVSLALVIPSMLIPVFSKTFVDEVLLSQRQTWLMPLLWGMGITAVLRGALTWLKEYFLLRLETKIALKTSATFLWHVLRLPIPFFTQRYSGDIATRMQSNDQVASVIAGKLTKTVVSLFMIVFYFLVMLRYDWLLTSLGVMAMVINMVYLKFVAKKRGDQNRKLMQDKGKLMGASMAGLQLIETLKANGSEADFFAKWSGYQAKALNAEQKMNGSRELLTAIPTLLAGLTDVAILIVGGLRILSGDMTVGMLVAFQSFMKSFMEPVNDLVSFGNMLQEMEGDMSRLDDVLHYPVDEQTNEQKYFDYQEKYQLEGQLQINDISFGYSPLDPPLIENFNLDVTPGSRVALVGSSGSGKSTLAKLMTGIYQPWEGKILFDGCQRHEHHRDVLNNSVSVVNQEIAMFEGSVRDNITLWDTSIEDEAVIKAAKDACIHETITERVSGYGFKVSEGGSNFSGGQRQRLEIARALVTNPSILIMDEATSALDPLTEKEIDEHIRRRGCTCIIVAHRLSTIRDCDEIIFLDQGKIVERGTHEELVAMDGAYAKLIQG